MIGVHLAQNRDQAMRSGGGEITVLLREWSGGSASALGNLVPIVHAELIRVAGRSLRGRRASNTLVPSALVNEAYLRLCRFNCVEWNDRAHFFSVAAQLMRRILIDHARARHSAKRDGGIAVTLSDEMCVSASRDVDLIDLDRALHDLERLDPRQARIVELRCFTGLSVEETAVALSISCPTVKRDWAVAKTWIKRRLEQRETLLA